MGICKVCEFFNRHYSWNFGECTIINDSIPAWEAQDKITGDINNNPVVGENFGCIHFKQKDNEKDKTKS